MNEQPMSNRPPIMEPKPCLSGGAELIDKIGALAGEFKPGSVPTPHGPSDTLIFLPNNMRVENLKQFCPPQYVEETVRLQDVESFNAYVNRFKTEDTLIFCNVEDGATFGAFIDYHGAGPNAKPGRHKHRAFFTARETPEWLVLQIKNQETMTQAQFAEFLEENAKMFRNPSGADLLELVRTLHGHKNARFQQAVRLDNGANSVAFEEDIVVKSQNATKAGNYELPGTFKVGCAIYMSGEPWEITCRLKVRISERQIVLFYEIVGKNEIIREATLSLVKQVSKGTEIVPFLGGLQ